MDKIAILVNATAGARQTASTVRAIREAFQLFGDTPHLALAHAEVDLIDRAVELANQEYDTIVAAGGDGTVKTLAQIAINSKKTLGIIPTGTLNHFAKDLGLPLEISSAVKTILKGKTISVDVGSINGHVFVNNANIGIYPKIIRRREKLRQTGWKKWTAAAIASLRTLRQYSRLKVRIVTKEKKVDCHTPFVFVGNNRYTLQGSRLGGRHNLMGGELSVYIAHSRRRLDLLSFTRGLMTGTLKSIPQFDMIHTKEIWIEVSKPHLSVAIDGEIEVLSTPLHYQIHPHRLSVRVST